MANIGLRKIIIAKKESNGYGTPAALGHAVSVEVNPNFAEGALYGDDVKVEEDRELTDASLTLGITHMPVEFNETLFGHTVNENATTYNADDEANVVGTAFIGVEKINKQKKYVATFLPESKYVEPGTTANTKGDSISYSTPSISGTAFVPADKNWKFDEVFDTEAAALDWINTKFGVTAGNNG